MRSIWLNRFLTASVWALAAAGMVYWALKFVRGVDVPASAGIASFHAPAQSVDPKVLARGLGGALDKNNALKIGAVSADSTSTNAQNGSLNAARFVLTGVVSGQSAAALLAVDGKAPRPYRVGAAIAPSVYLKSVSPAKAQLATSRDGETALILQLPKPGQVASASINAPIAVPVAAPVAAPPMQAITPGSITSRAGFQKQRELMQRATDASALAPAVLENNPNPPPPVVNPPIVN